MKSVRTALAALILLSTGLSCNGKSQYVNLPDALVRYPETELSTFSIAGSAHCDWCAPSQVTALQVEVVPVDDPMKTLDWSIFDGLGPFSFTDLRYKKDAKLTLYGKLLFGAGNTGATSATEITVPQNDGETVSCVINFPPR